MKTKLLSLFASALVCTNVSAGEWKIPVPEIQSEIIYGDTVYLYNNDAKAFYVGGNIYGTHGSIGPRGYKCILEKGDDGFVSIKNYVDAKSNWYYAFCENKVHEIFVDYNNNGETKWIFQDKGNGNYYIYTTCSLQASYPLGVTTSAENKTILNFTDPEFENQNWLNWCIVSKEAYKTYDALYDIYEAAVALNAMISEAVETGIDNSHINAAQTVYDNTESTLEQLKQAHEDLQNAINNYKENFYSPENPNDLTELYIPDADFELNQGAGVWKRTHSAQNYQTNGTAGKLGDQTVFLEAWNGSAFSGKQYVEITGLPNGVYQFFLSVATSGGNGSYVYAGTDSIEVTSTEITPYFVFTRVQDGTLEVGYDMPKAIQNWVGIDDAKLLYLGNSVESYRFWVEKFIEKAPVVDDETFAQSSMVKAYNELLETDLNKFTTVQEVIDFQAQIVKAIADIKANMAAYATFNEIYEAIDALIVAGYEGDAADALFDSYTEGEIDKIYAEKTLSTEEMIERCKAIAADVDYVKKNCLAPGMDCTNLLVNPNFTNRIEGWSHDTKYADVAWGGLSTNPCVECWNANFDFYQVVEGVPNGVYELTVQAFYRPTGDTKKSYDNFISETKDEILAFIYANSSETPVLNIGTHTYDHYLQDNSTEVEAGKYCPNGMKAASEVFSLGDYKNTVKGVVVDGVLKVGIKSTTGTAEGRWTLWDNFTLKYVGKDFEAIAGVIEGYAETVEEYTSDDKIMETALKSVVNQKYLDASDAIDGASAYDALVELVNAINTAKASAEAYVKLKDANETLATDVENAVSDDQALKTEATVLYSAVDEFISNGSIATADIDAKIAEIMTVCAKLRIPPYADASDSNPVDFTTTIVNPSFEGADGKGTLAGWTDAGAINVQPQTNDSFGKTGNAYCERWRVNGAVNIYQTITNLPSGYYTLSADAHCETTDGVIFANDNEVAIENTQATAPAHLSVSAFVGEDGLLKIGGKCNLTDATWFCIDNFSLIYTGQDAPTAIKKADVPAEAPVAETYSISGTRLNGLMKGINIVRMSDGSVKKVLVK